MAFSKSDQRRVLLIDHDSRRQQLRAAALRNCQVEVDTANNIDEAARLLVKHSYNLVLLAAEQDSQEVALLSRELTRCKPRQRIALLVGAPHYLREVGREPRDPDPANRLPAPGLLAETMQPQPTYWQVMMHHLLAVA